MAVANDHPVEPITVTGVLDPHALVKPLSAIPQAVVVDPL